MRSSPLAAAFLALSSMLARPTCRVKPQRWQLNSIAPLRPTSSEGWFGV
jgi:hypothetical protein